MLQNGIRECFMPPLTIHTNHLMVSGETPAGRSPNDPSGNCCEALGQKIVGLRRGAQLAMANPVLNKHIATGVTRPRLDHLAQADAQTTHAYDTPSLDARRILDAKGMDMAGLGNEMIVRLARIAVQDPDNADQIHTLFSRSQGAALSLARAFEGPNRGAASKVAELLPNIQNNSLDAATFTQLGDLAGKEPELTKKLVGKVQTTLAGAPGAPTLPALRWLIGIAVGDPVMADLRGANFSANDLPTAADLGFEPALHISLPAPLFQAAKTLTAAPMAWISTQIAGASTLSTPINS